jgi:hypothetical protein
MNCAGFRERARETVLGWEAMVHRMAGSERHRDGLWMPWRRAQSSGRGCVLMHGNMQCALRVLGCTAASTWRGHGDMDGRDRWHLIQGIGQGVLREVSGKATGLETVGGVQARLGCSRWAWVRLGGVGCWPGASAGWG